MEEYSTMTDIAKEPPQMGPQEPPAEQPDTALPPMAEPLREDESQDPDYEAMAAEDLLTLCERFPEMGGAEDLSVLTDPARYGALRELGLSPEEAYLATGRRKGRPDNRAHLRSAVPTRAAGGRASMTEMELQAARELFGDLSDRELRRLYKQVTM